VTCRDFRVFFLSTCLCVDIPRLAPFSILFGSILPGLIFSIESGKRGRLRQSGSDCMCTIFSVCDVNPTVVESVLAHKDPGLSL